MSDEVAEDYKRALEELSMNTRVEISNLTVIAQENIEHALAISEALKNHIRTTSPQKKLPALYVLDSIVKNVGTPYTIFFGRQLYNTFMQAYALVDNNVRRKLDEMLKTWKEPVPGSIESRPVFPADITRPIENALIKARTSAAQAEQARNQQMGRGRPSMSQPPYQQTPTPPNVPGFAPPGPYANGYSHPFPNGGQAYPSTPQLPPNGQHYLQPMGAQQFPPPTYNTAQYTPQQFTGYDASGHYAVQQTPTTQFAPQPDQTPWYPPSATTQFSSHHTPESSVDALSNDIASLIFDSKQEFARDPMDSSIQTRLKALLDLQNILQSRALPHDQLELVRAQVAQLSRSTRSSIVRSSVTPAPAPPTPVTTAPLVVQQPDFSSLLRSTALAELLAKQSSTPVPTPPPQSAVPVRSPVPQPRVELPLHTAPSTSSPASAVAPSIDATSLLAKLKASGLLSTSTPTSTTPVMSSTALPPTFPATAPGPRDPLAVIPNDVVLKPYSLKMPRPHLIATLHEKLGPPCSQCGRRFPTDEQGKKRRTAHMDWHFRIHQRINDSERRGQHRSWFVDELDWIKSRESLDEEAVHVGDENAGSSNNNVAAPGKPKLQYLAVPDDPDLANSVCSICQEKFVTTWHDEAQEFVWLDARKVGNKIYHASCFAEATKDGGKGNDRFPRLDSPALESILGKRKAVDEEDSESKTKIKLEP